MTDRLTILEEAPPAHTTQNRITLLTQSMRLVREHVADLRFPAYQSDYAREENLRLRAAALAVIEEALK